MENQVTQDRVIRYRSDRGDIYEVSKMETSHLINAIGHHMRQREILASITLGGNIGKRYSVISQVIEILVKELETREPTEKEYLP